MMVTVRVKKCLCISHRVITYAPKNPTLGEPSGNLFFPSLNTKGPTDSIRIIPLSCVSVYIPMNSVLCQTDRFVVSP